MKRLIIMLVLCMASVAGAADITRILSTISVTTNAVGYSRTNSYTPPASRIVSVTANPVGSGATGTVVVLGKSELPNGTDETIASLSAVTSNSVIRPVVTVHSALGVEQALTSGWSPYTLCGERLDVIVTNNGMTGIVWNVIIKLEK
jgi:hypothetical protein